MKRICLVVIILALFVNTFGFSVSANGENLAKGREVTVKTHIAKEKSYAEMDRIAFIHMRNVTLMEDGSFEESGHYSACGSLDMYEITKALVDNGFDGYVRPDHGRMIWGETGKPGYGLFDRALGATYINGLFEALEKENAKK